MYLVRRVHYMDDNQLKKSLLDAKVEINHILDSFAEKLENGTSDPDHFMTMSEIENAWASLRNNTDKIYSDIISERLRNLDERELIRSKKENSKGKGLV